MDECHGLLVTHLDGRLECLDEDCVTLDAPRHDWRTSCDDVPGFCSCAADRAAAERARRTAA